MRWKLVLAALLCAGGFAATALSSTAGSACSSAEKAQRAQAAAAFAARMPTARAAYFKRHKRAADRGRFVKAQQAKLTLLRGAAACVVPPPAATTTTPAPPPPVATQQTFTFDSGIPADAQAEIRADVDYAARDEARLLGVELTVVSVFVSTSPDWLADQECRFFGHDSDACRQSTRDRWASGGTTAVAGSGGMLLYWAHPSWQAGPGDTQKIIAHELFHVLQTQLDKLGPRDDVTPSSQVRASGPVWLTEGSAELVGYRVASDRGFTDYASVLANQVARARQVAQPPSAVETYDRFNAVPNPYSYGQAAADHLVGLAPGGLPALAAYYNALGAGTDWPTAFRNAFGIAVDAYDASFAAFLAKS